MTFEIVAMFLFLLQISRQAYFTHSCIVGVYVCLSIYHITFFIQRRVWVWVCYNCVAYRTVDTHGSRNLKSNIIRRTEALGVGRNLGEGLEGGI